MVKEYLRLTRTGTYGFLVALPLILGYEFFLILGGTNQRVVADLWIQKLLRPFGIYGHLAGGLLIVLTGIVIVLLEQKKDIKLKPGFFGLMLGESILWTPIFYLIVGYLTARAVAPALAAATLDGMNVFTRIGLSLGAGVYEELVFRVILVSGLAYLGRQAVPEQRNLIYCIVAVVGAMIFSLCHYLGPEQFSFTSFLFRFIGGLALNILYITRGFGIAAWTHAWYDIMVLVHMG